VGKYTKKVKCDFVTYEYIHKPISNHYIYITTVHTYFYPVMDFWLCL